LCIEGNKIKQRNETCSNLLLINTVRGIAGAEPIDIDDLFDEEEEKQDKDIPKIDLSKFGSLEELREYNKKLKEGE
jgi:hypothetical protein